MNVNLLKDNEMNKRNKMIFKLREDGWSWDKLAKKYNLCPTRIIHIVDKELLREYKGRIRKLIN